MTKKYVDIYNMTSDHNFGPYHDGDLLSLACCMVKIRKRVGKLWNSMENPEKNLEYWVVGRVASSLSSSKKNHLVYFMKVDNVLTFAEYGRKYETRKNGNGRNDNIYEFDEGKTDEFEPSNYKVIHSEPGHSPEHDIGKGKFVLLSEDYCYFDWRNNPYDEKLGRWGFDELKWVAPGKNGPFRRKYDFENTKKIIEKLENIKLDNCQKFEPNFNEDRRCGNQNKIC